MHERRNPWYATQEDAGLPFTFDEWRRRYDTLSCDDQRAYYDAVYEKFPVQRACRLDEAARFFASLPAGVSVVELGGGDGHSAARLLDRFPIRSWRNIELSRRAVDGGRRHPRYAAVVPDRFPWDWPSWPAADVFFASHVLEHLRAAQAETLLERLGSVRYAYVECPLPDDADAIDWSGRWNTHILEIGWKQLAALFRRYGLETIHRSPDVRWLARDASWSLSKRFSSPRKHGDTEKCR